MPCVLVGLAVLFPRLLMIGIWLLTDWFARAYETTIWPLLGWLVMPYTTLAYMVAKVNNGQVEGWWLGLMILAVILDVSCWGDSGRRLPRRQDELI
jgi:hypothetical protein